jgi:hypothetical protein
MACSSGESDRAWVEHSRNLRMVKGRQLESALQVTEATLDVDLHEADTALDIDESTPDDCKNPAFSWKTE